MRNPETHILHIMVGTKNSVGMINCRSWNVSRRRDGPPHFRLTTPYSLASNSMMIKRLVDHTRLLIENEKARDLSHFYYIASDHTTEVLSLPFPSLVND